MIWIEREGRVLSSPYSICRSVRGFDVWYRRGDKFGVLGREITTLDKAKDFCEKHRAKEAELMKSLDAVDAK
jgi:hypothetical protein